MHKLLGKIEQRTYLATWL
jgi:hypothetical protein